MKSKIINFVFSVLVVTIVSPLSGLGQPSQSGPMSDRAVQTLADMYLDENGLLKDYTPTDERLGGDIFSDADQPSVIDDLQRLAEMMPCEEGERLQVMQAVADRQALEDAKFQNANVIGKDDRRPVTAEEQQGDARGVGVISCLNPGTNKRAFSTASVAGSRMTLIGSGHFLDQNKIKYFDVENCNFKRFDENGRKLFETNLLESKRFEQAAVIVMEKPVPYSAMSKEPMDLVSLSRQELLHADGLKVVGHPLDIPQPKIKKVSDSCEVVDSGIPEPYFHHNCDNNPGASGSPFVITYKGRRVIAAVDAMEYIDINAGITFTKNVLAYMEEKISSAKERLSREK